MTISLEFPPHAWNIIYKHVFPQFFFQGKTANPVLRKAKIPKIQFDWQLNCRTVVLLPQSLKSLEMESEGDSQPQRCVLHIHPDCNCNHLQKQIKFSKV